MSKHSFLIIVAAVIAALMCSPAMAQNDSIWIESEMVYPGGIYSVSMYCQIYQEFGSLEVPLVSSSEALVFDTVTKEGSVIPEEMFIGGIIKNDGNRILINFIPAFPLNPINPPGGKLCEIYFHIKPNAMNQVIAMDTLTDTIYTDPLTLTWLRGWAPDGITQIPLAFQAGYIEVLSGADCGDANDDGTVNISDAVYIIDYIFVGGNPPVLYYLADVNLDGKINLTDVIYLVNYIFRGGPEPCAK
jgi:hypothetical protein